jgi:DNA-binding NarL/FixJ family response regulator
VEQTKARVLIVAHNLLLREGLCNLVSRQPDMDLMGVATSARDAVQSFQKHRPAVVLMDLDLPEFTGVKSIREICEVDPTVCVIALSTFPLDDSANLALDAGARTCITKDRVIRDLVKLIRECVGPEV